MRFRSALALMVAGLLLATGIASAQSTTTTNTDTLSGYTGSTTTAQTQTQATKPTKTTSASPTPTTEGQEESSAAPTVAAQSAPSNLAFTGGEPLLLIIAGLAIAGGTATLLIRDRRRSENS